MALAFPDRRLVGRVLLTAAIGTTGGALAALIDFPAAWLAGSMIAVATASLAGVPCDLPAPLRNLAFVLLGTSMGSGLTPESIDQMRAWPMSILMLTLSVAATMLTGSLYLRYVHRWDAVSAKAATIPGALSAVLVLAAASNADLPRVVLAQSLRLFALVALMPLILSFSSEAAQNSGLLAPPVASSLGEALLTLAAAGATALLLAHLRVPGGMLLGAMVASATLHGTGLVHGRLPPLLVTLGFVTVGAMIGVRFRGTRLAEARRTLPGALGSILLALIVSALFTGLGSLLLDLPFSQLWIAYAPGAVEAMAAIALALGFDPAFVGAHHILRILALNLASPLILRPPRPRRHEGPS